MRKLFIFSFALLCISGSVKSQSAKAVFFEIGGPGIASFNLDVRFTGRQDGIGGRIGVGGFSINDEKALYVPVGINYLVGKNTKHYFEMGAGVTYVDYNYADDGIFFPAGNDDDGILKHNFGFLNLGYRMQPLNNGFTFRATIVPIFNKHGFVPYYAGVSFGYKF